MSSENVSHNESPRFKISYSTPNHMDKWNSVLSLGDFFASWSRQNSRPSSILQLSIENLHNSSPQFNDYNSNSFLHKYYDPQEYDFKQNLIYEHLYTEIIPNHVLKPIPSEKLTNRIKLARKILFLVLILVAIMSAIVIAIFIIAYNRELSTDTDQIKPQQMTSESHENITRTRRDFVRGMFVEAWTAIKKAYKFELGTKKSIQLNLQVKESILITALTTLWVMELKEEFHLSKGWIDPQIDLSSNSNIAVIPPLIIVNYVGGLLSCYALTKESSFLQLATEIAQHLEPAFNQTTGLSYYAFNITTGKPMEFAREVTFHQGGFQPDYLFLADSTGKAHYREQIKRARKTLADLSKRTSNMLPYFIFVNGRWPADFETAKSTSVGLFAHIIAMLQALVNAYLQSNGRDVHAIELYKHAMDGAEKAQLFHESKTGLLYARSLNWKGKSYFDGMSSTSCGLGAMLTLGGEALRRALASATWSLNAIEQLAERERIARHLSMGERITETCHQASIRTKSGLTPYEFYFNLNHDATTQAFDAEATNFLINNFELSYSYFILWRHTHNPKYREYAWQLAQAIYAHCRSTKFRFAYASVVNVNTVPTTAKFKHQHSEFLSATLKYLYLTFSDDSVLPLDQWVFNSVGHPLPICGAHPSYPVEKCGKF